MAKMSEVHRWTVKRKVETLVQKLIARKIPLSSEAITMLHLEHSKSNSESYYIKLNCASLSSVKNSKNKNKTTNHFHMVPPNPMFYIVAQL